ncbi:MAG: hypothetical protein WAN50_01385 [Minisyncoccia bacterium]
MKYLFIALVAISFLFGQAVPAGALGNCQNGYVETPIGCDEIVAQNTFTAPDGSVVTDYETREGWYVRLVTDKGVLVGNSFSRTPFVVVQAAPPTTGQVLTVLGLYAINRIIPNPARHRHGR